MSKTLQEKLEAEIKEMATKIATYQQVIAMINAEKPRQTEPVKKTTVKKRKRRLQKRSSANESEWLARFKQMAYPKTGELPKLSMIARRYGVAPNTPSVWAKRFSEAGILSHNGVERAGRRYRFVSDGEQVKTYFPWLTPSKNG